MQIVVRHGSLTAETVETVNLPVDADTVEVLNRGTDDIYFTVTGTNPSVGGNDCEIVTAGSALEVNRKAAGHTTVKMVSESAVEYSVRGVKR
jgi:hypothetical protein